MTQKELLIIRIVAIFLIVFSLFVKYRFWRLAKSEKTLTRIKGFVPHIFIWYTLYDMFDSTNQEVKTFMRANNNTNKFFWISTAVLIISLVF